MVFLFGSRSHRRGAAAGRMVELLTYWNAHQLDVLTKRLEYGCRRRGSAHIVRG